MTAPITDSALDGIAQLKARAELSEQVAKGQRLALEDAAQLFSMIAGSCPVPARALAEQGFQAAREALDALVRAPDPAPDPPETER